MAKNKQKRWGAFQQKTVKYTLPGAGVEVVLKDPDVLGSFLLERDALPDVLISIFMSSTQQGTDDNPMLALVKDAEASQGLKRFLDIIARNAFVEPRLVDDPEAADYETTIPIDAISLTDKMAVMDLFQGVRAQLDGVTNFRTKQNGTVAAAPQGEELQPVTKSDSGD